MTKFSPIILALIVILAGSQAKGEKPMDFSHQVAPILKEHCSGCHMNGKKKGGFSLNSNTALLTGSENGKVLDAAHPEKSRMLEVLLSDDPEVLMPPPAKDRARPTPAQITILREWLLAGAAWEEGFAFEKPKYNAPLKHRPPQLPNGAQSQGHPLDGLLSDYYAKHNVPLPKPADDATFVRRVFLDLIGLLPAPEELAAFCQNTAPNKRAQLVDSLLARNTDFAEHWLTFWNDLLRNDYAGTGFITGGRKQVSAWLYDALLSNRPYDTMVKELLNPTPETEGYAQGITWRGTVSASQTREVQFAQSVSQSFLGLNLKCASCHDSFIDHWKLTDAYGLAAVYAEKPIEMARCEKLTGKMAVPAWPFPELGQINAEAPRAERLQQLAALMTHPENGWFARTIVNRFWAALLGRGLVHPVDAMGSEPWSEEVLDYLGWALAQNKFDLKQTIRLITTSAAYQAEVVPRVKEDSTTSFVFRGPRAKRLSAEQFVDAVWRFTGAAPTTWDAPVRRNEPKAEASGVRPFPAEWIQSPATATAPDGKPASGNLHVVGTTIHCAAKPSKVVGVIASNQDVRVFVNGTELKGAQQVKFGKTSELYPEKLFQKGENAVAIATTRTDGKPGAAVCLGLELTLPDGSVQTLGTDASWSSTANFTAEWLKQGKLGPLVEKAKWKVSPSMEFQSALWTTAAISEQPPAAELVPARLSLDYLWARQPKPPARAALMKSDLLMRTLGRPNRDQIVTSRPQELSTLEALDLSAGARLNKLLEAGAPRLLSQSAGEPMALLERLYNSSLCRPPSKEERDAAMEVLGTKPTPQAVEDLLWAILDLPEFQLIR